MVKHQVQLNIFSLSFY